MLNSLILWLLGYLGLLLTRKRQTARRIEIEITN
jgi:hypothetical protein